MHCLSLLLFIYIYIFYINFILFYYFLSHFHLQDNVHQPPSTSYPSGLDYMDSMLNQFPNKNNIAGAAAGFGVSGGGGNTLNG